MVENIRPASRSSEATTDSRRDLIIAAARRCFIKYTADKTTIDDIAKEANIARSGVYRYFANREEIFEAAIICRMVEFVAGCMPLMTASKSFGDTLSIVSMATIDTGRNDPELRQMFGAQSNIEIIDILGGARPAVHHLVLDFWKPVFNRARVAGEMRPEISDDEAIDWMRGVYVMLILRKKLDPEQERGLIDKFLLYSLLTPTALATRAADKIC